MKSDNIVLARELLLQLEPSDVITTQVNIELNTRTQYDKYPADLIEWLVDSKLLVLADVVAISPQSTVEIFQLSMLGEQVAEFLNLAAWYGYGIDGEKMFMEIGNSIYAALDMYTETELEPMVKLLTREEQDAYNHYYKIQIYNSIGGRGTIVETTKDDSDKNITLAEGFFLPIFELSVALGKNTDNTRTDDYVLKKCVEELGELSLELQIAQGTSYKDAGFDGIDGEAVDLAICAMDMFALQHPNETPEILSDMFFRKMNEKLNKWKSTIGR